VCVCVCVRAQGGVLTQVRSWYGSVLVGTRWTFTVCVAVHGLVLASGTTNFSHVCMSPLTFIYWYQGVPSSPALAEPSAMSRSTPPCTTMYNYTVNAGGVAAAAGAPQYTCVTSSHNHLHAC
jgi:hypothetical protein